jgi:hypothetical protein
VRSAIENRLIALPFLGLVAVLTDLLRLTRLQKFCLLLLLLPPPPRDQLKHIGCKVSFRADGALCLSKCVTRRLSATVRVVQCTSTSAGSRSSTRSVCAYGRAHSSCCHTGQPLCFLRPPFVIVTAKRLFRVAENENSENVLLLS